MYLLVFHAYVNEMHRSRSEIPSKKSRQVELRGGIYFRLLKVNKNATETYEKLKLAYGEHAVSSAQVFRWHKAF